ncbi:MAG TPA: hypothetical protein VFZ58_02745 [Candidatus Saccharimonadales bacterium]
MVAVFVAIVWLGMFYHAHALPNVQLASAEAGHKTLPELEVIAKKQFQKLRFQFISPTKTVTTSAAALGITLDAPKTAAYAYNLRRNLTEGAQLWRPLNTPLIVHYNRESVMRFLALSFGNEFVPPVNATIRYNEKLQEFEVVEGKLGKGFSVEEVMASIRRQAWQPGLLTFQSAEAVEPVRIAASIAKTADKANAITRLRFSFLYKNKVMYIAEPPEIAAWLTFAPGSEATGFSVGCNRRAIADFLEQRVTKSLNDFYGPAGSIPAEDPTVQPATTPLRLQAIDDLINDIAAAASKLTNSEKELKVAEE